MIDELFAAIDNKDANAFGAFLTEDCVFRFANQAPVKGRPAVVAYVDRFFESVRGLSHEQDDAWRLEDEIVLHGQVTYTRHSGDRLKVPFANVLRLDGEKIREYLIFVDASELFAE